MRTPRSAAAVLGLALACAAALPAHAQTFPTIRVGQSLQGRLAETDPAYHQGSHFKVYQFRAEAGRRYVATMQAEEFDSYLAVARTVGGITDEMFFDDDGGTEPLSSRLRFQVPATGTYLLIARSLGEGGVGAFTVALDTLTVRPPVIHDIAVGQTDEGALSEDDSEYDDPGGFYDLYRFRGTAGQRLRVRMDFEEGYAPSLDVGTMQNGQFTPLDEMSDGMSPLNLSLPEAGEYYIRAGAYGGVTGTYTLRLEERAPAVEPRTQALRRGESAQGTIEQGDGELDDGRWYDAYAYTGRAGETLRVEMASEDFDAYLIIGRYVDGEFQELDRNDDDPEGDDTDSALQVELPEDGRYVIQATTFLPEQGGAYEITVREP
jgi:hypothetical protein